MLSTDELLSSVVPITRSEKRRGKEIITNIISGDFIDFMKTEDEMFKHLYKKVYYTGSFYDGLRIISADEFDLNIELEIFSTDQPPAIDSDIPNIPGFATYPLYNHKVENNLRVIKKFSENGYLSPDKLRWWFKSVFTKAFAKLKMKHNTSRLTYKESGPAMTVCIALNDNGYEIDVDLVPVIRLRRDEQSSYFFLVPKPYTGDRPGAKYFWRLSFPNEEKMILKDKSGPKKVIMLLKLFLLKKGSSLQRLCSYHMKTLVMLEVKQNGSWSDGHLDEYFMKMLEKLRDCMERNYLPSVHDSDFNLLYNLPVSSLLNNHGQLRRICNKIDKNPYYHRVILQSAHSVTVPESWDDVMNEGLPCSLNQQHASSQRLSLSGWDDTEHEESLSLSKAESNGFLYFLMGMGAVALGGAYAYSQWGKEKDE